MHHRRLAALAVLGLVAVIAVAGYGISATRTSQPTTTTAAKPAARAFVAMRDFQYGDLPPDQLKALANPQVQQFLTDFGAKEILSRGKPVGIMYVFVAVPGIGPQFADELRKAVTGQAGVEPQQTQMASGMLYTFDGPKQKTVMLDNRKGLVILVVAPSLRDAGVILQEWADGTKTLAKPK